MNHGLTMAMVKLSLWNKGRKKSGYCSRAFFVMVVILGLLILFYGIEQKAISQLRGIQLIDRRIDQIRIGYVFKRRIDAVDFCFCLG